MLCVVPWLQPRRFILRNGHHSRAGGLAVPALIRTRTTAAPAPVCPTTPGNILILLAERISFLSILLREFQTFPKRLALLPD